MIVNNSILPNTSYAANEEQETDALGSFITNMLGVVVGLLTWPLRIIALAVGWAVNAVTSVIAYSEGAVDPNGNFITPTSSIITPFEILFNKIALVDINFFNFGNVSDTSIIFKIRTTIAAWYYIMRNIAAAILLCICIYVGIRMAISTIAQEEAKYKKMLFDWVCSLAIIFILHYIIVFTINISGVIVRALGNMSDGKDLADAISAIGSIAAGVDITAIGATIVYCLIVSQTLGLFFTYFNRMLKIAFLIIIAPLITLTYSIDKMGDGKAQALGTWLKEFVYTVLIQPFHCIIFMVFIDMALEIFRSPAATDGKAKLAGAIIAMLCIKFTKEAEKLLGKIFSFGDATSDTSLAVGMAASAMALNKAKSIGKGTKKAIKGVKNVKNNVKGMMRNAKVDMLTARNFFKTGEDGKKLSIEEARDLANTRVTEKEAKKLEKKNEKKYGVSKDTDVEYQKQLADATKANMDAGMSEGLAKATARAQVAKRTREKQIKENPKGFRDWTKSHLKYNKVRGTLHKVKKAMSNSETLKSLSGYLKTSVASGIGLATGSMAFANSNAVSAIMTGTAAATAAKELMTSTSKTINNENSALLAASGDKTAEDAAKHMNNIMLNSENFQNAEEYLKNLLKELDSALGDMADKDKNTLKGSIKNIVQREILSHPNSTNDKIKNSVLNNTGVQKILSDNGINNTESIGNTIGKVANFQRDKRIYDNIQNGVDAGSSPEVLVANSIDTFERDYTDYYRSSKQDAQKHAEERVESMENEEGDSISQEEAEGLNVEQIDATQEEINKKMEQLNQERDNVDENNPERIAEIESVLEKLKESYENILLEKYNKELKKIVDKKKECERILQDTVDNEVYNKVRSLAVQERNQLNEQMRILEEDRTQVISQYIQQNNINIDENGNDKWMQAESKFNEIKNGGENNN